MFPFCSLAESLVIQLKYLTSTRLGLNLLLNAASNKLQVLSWAERKVDLVESLEVLQIKMCPLKMSYLLVPLYQLSDAS